MLRQRKKMTYEREICKDTQAVVFRLSGVLTGIQECYDFVEIVRDEIHDGNTFLVFNLEKIEMVNSTGIGILASCYTSITNANGFMTLVATSERVQAVLEMVCLWPLLKHHDSEAEALAELKKRG